MSRSRVKNSEIFNSQKGVSLIEILVTTLILGIGLLGVAALQVSSISSSQEGFFHSQATSIAEDLASRMRSSKMLTMIETSTHRTQIPYATYLGNYALNANPVACGGAPAKMCRANSGATPDSCTLEEVSAFDLWEACSVAEDTLPDPKIRVINTVNRMTVVVEWASASARADMGQQTNVNVSCNAIIGSADRNCVLVEIVP